MKLIWEKQEDGAWFAYGVRKDKPDNYKVMGKIVPPNVRHPNHWFWLFTDENIAGGCTEDGIEGTKLYMERMVVNQ